MRTRLRLLNAQFGVVVEEGWVQSNHFFELTKRVRGCAEKNEVVLLDEADKVWRKLPEHHQQLWHIFRWTVSHASEAAGLMWVDIDLSSGVIQIKNEFGGSGSETYLTEDSLARQ